MTVTFTTRSMSSSIIGLRLKLYLEFVSNLSIFTLFFQKYVVEAEVTAD
jgi:hypothetical protein